MFNIDLTTDNLRVLTADATQNTKVVIKDKDGNRQIASVRYETVRKLVPKVDDATIETGHETIGLKEQSTTQLVIQLI